MFDVNDFFINYYKGVNSFIKNRDKELEKILNLSEEFKIYQEALSKLNEKVMEINLPLFKKESTKVLNILADFDPNKIPEHIDFVYSGIDWMEEIKEKLDKVSKKFNNIRNFWHNTAVVKYRIDKNTVFAHEIDNKIIEVQKLIEESDATELGRVEERVEELVKKINKAIAIFDNIKNILEHNVFIGREAELLEQDMLKFLSEGYKDKHFVDVLSIADDLTTRYSNILAKNNFIRKQIPVYKATSKNNVNGAYSYFIKIQDLYINMTDIEIEDYEIEFIDRYIYVDNFPTFGIWGINYLKENMEIPDEAITLIKEFDILMFNIFIFMAVFILFLFIIGIFSLSFIAVPLGFSFVAPFWYKKIFHKMKRKLDKKYGLNKQFYFFEINYFFVKEGDRLFRFERLTPLILMHFDEIFKESTNERQ